MNWLLRFKRLLFCLLVVSQVYQGIGQLVITAFSGADVLLPCSYTEAGDLQTIPSVFWIDQDDKVVVKIEQSFTGNAFATAFPEEYKKGNFSILVKRAQPSHSGIYLCSITSMYYTRKIYLNVSERGSEARGGSPEAAAALPHLLLTVLLPLLL